MYTFAKELLNFLRENNKKIKLIWIWMHFFAVQSSTISQCIHSHSFAFGSPLAYTLNIHFNVVVVCS